MFKNKILNNELEVFKETKPESANDINLQIENAVKEIESIDISTLNLADTINLGKELRTKKNNYSENRKTFFKPLNELLGSFINIDKAYQSKIDELKEHYDELTGKERLANEVTRRTALVIALEGVIPSENKDDIMKHFGDKIDEYIEKEKTRNILTETGKIKKAELDKLILFIDNFATAVIGLGEIGLARFKSNGLEYREALQFQNEQLDLAKAQLAKEQGMHQAQAEVVQERKQQGYATIKESQVEELVEVDKEIRTRTVTFTYTEDKADFIKETIMKLREQDVRVEVKK